MGHNVTRHEGPLQYPQKKGERFLSGWWLLISTADLWNKCDKILQNSIAFGWLVLRSFQYIEDCFIIQWFKLSTIFFGAEDISKPMR